MVKRCRSNDSPLNELFPDIIERRKGRVLRGPQGVINLPHPATQGRSLRTLTPRQKLQGVVSRHPEVIVKIGKANIKSRRHLVKAMDYMARNGKLDTEDKDGTIFFSKEGLRELANYWQVLSRLPEEEESRFGEARRLILSMPVTTPTEPFKEACRQWAAECLAGYDYLMAFHLPENDKRTHQPHCHILVRTLGRDGTRLHIDNAQRDGMREHFAVCLRAHGIDATATRRWQRGVTRRSLTQPELHNLKRYESDKARARAHAIARKKAARKVKLLGTLQNRKMEVSEAVKRGTSIPDHPAIVNAKERRAKLKVLVRETIKILEKGSPDDKQLARQTKDFYDRLPPVQSVTQEALPKARAQHIRRMQAMRKRKAWER